MRISCKIALTCLASTIGGIVAYSGLFLVLIRIKFIRHLADSAGQESLLTAEVVLGSLACIITLTAVVFLFFDRNLAGRFFFIAAIVGVLLIVLNTPLLLVPYQRSPQGLERYILTGVFVGNTAIVASNIGVFFLKLPSL